MSAGPALLAWGQLKAFTVPQPLDPLLVHRPAPGRPRSASTGRFLLQRLQPVRLVIPQRAVHGAPSVLGRLANSEHFARRPNRRSTCLQRLRLLQLRHDLLCRKPLSSRHQELAPGLSFGGMLPPNLDRQTGPDIGNGADDQTYLVADCGSGSGRWREGRARTAAMPGKRSSSDAQVSGTRLSARPRQEVSSAESAFCGNASSWRSTWLTTPKPRHPAGTPAALLAFASPTPRIVGPAER